MITADIVPGSGPTGCFLRSKQRDDVLALQKGYALAAMFFTEVFDTLDCTLRIRSEC